MHMRPQVLFDASVEVWPGEQLFALAGWDRDAPLLAQLSGRGGPWPPLRAHGAHLRVWVHGPRLTRDEPR